jgi:hypothetical protein
MTVLCSFYNVAPADYTLIRQYLDYSVVGWWDMHFVQAGQYSILQEHVYGGYRFHLKWKDWFWSVRAGAGRRDDVLEDLYVTAPGDPTPINAGTITWDVKYDSRTKFYVVYFGNNPYDGHYALNRFTPVPSTYWYTSTPLATFETRIDYVP